MSWERCYRVDKKSAVLLNIMRVCKASKLGTKQRGMECEKERKRER